MTVPDHTPYLAATDLRTPEDVLAWLRTSELTRARHHMATGGTESGVTHYSDEAMLAYRLDRERRQACRRGALELIRAIARQKLWLRSDYAQNKGAERFGTFAKCMAHQRETRWGSDLRRALAFRAAARAE